MTEADGRPLLERLPRDGQGRPVIRRSLLQWLLTCAEYRPGAGDNAAFGTIAHDAFAAYWKRCLEAREETRLGDLEAIAHESFYRRPAGVHPDRYAELLELLSDFARRRFADLAVLWKVEFTLTATADLGPPIGPVVLTGTVDRIERTDDDDPDDPPSRLRLVDYKTQWPIERHWFQKATYAALARHGDWPSVQEVETAWDHVRLRSADALVEETLAAEQIDEHWRKGMLEPLRNALLAPSGVYTGGAACQWCALRRTCAESLAPFGRTPDTVEEARDLLSSLLRRSEVADGERAELRAFLERREPIVVGGKQVGFMRPLDETFKVTDPFGVVSWYRGLGRASDELLATWIDVKQIPAEDRDALVAAGVARWEPGPVQFRVRNADQPPKKAKGEKA